MYILFCVSPRERMFVACVYICMSVLIPKRSFVLGDATQKSKERMMAGGNTRFQGQIRMHNPGVGGGLTLADFPPRPPGLPP